MMIEEKDFRESLQRLLKGAFAVVALVVLKTVVGFFLNADDRFLGMTPGAWVDVVLSLVIVGFAATLYQPVKTVVAFYLAALVKAGKLPGWDKHLDNLVAAAGNLTLLVFVLFGYLYVLPVIKQINYAFLHFGFLTTALNVIVLFGAMGILFMLWKNVEPFIDLLTGLITDKVSALSSRIAYVDCPACNTRNNRDSGFCVSCGATLHMPQAESAPAGTTPGPQSESPGGECDQVPPHGAQPEVKSPESKPNLRL